MVSYLARTSCRSWVKHQFAAPTIRGLLGVELPNPDMTVPVTERSLGDWWPNDSTVVDSGLSTSTLSNDRFTDGACHDQCAI